MLDDNGLARTRKKRKFGEDDNVASPSNLTDDIDPDVDFREYAKNLIRQAQISQQEDTHEDPPAPPPIPQPTQSQPSATAAPPSSTSTASKTQVKLADLFNYTLDNAVGEGLGFYWPGSVKNLEEDLLAHEHAASEANTPTSAHSGS